MTREDFDMIDAYWIDHPPLHLMVAAYLGVKPRKTKKLQPAELIDNLSSQAGWTVRTMH